MKIPASKEPDTTERLRNTDPKLHDEENKRRNEPTEMDQASFPHYKRVSDFLLGSCIGEGSFAKVRVGFHCLTKEKVAIKIINKAKAREDSYVYKNLHREGKLLQLLRHPNIVQIFDILETSNNYYLITELCKGGELIDIVSEQGPLPEETVRKYMKQLVDAVAYMQERHIVHRDLKVENLLLDSKDNIKIIDFGLSNILPDHNSDSSRSLVTQCGSPAYAAPELLEKKSYGPKVDVWSIGVITYALLVGKLPFTVKPFSIPKLCKKMLRGEMNPIPTILTSFCRTFISKLLTPNHVSRPTIHEAAKLKWLSLHAFNKSTPKNSNSMYIDLLESDENARGHHNQLLLQNPIIDSSVVSEMSSSFGFNSSEVVRNVQKNRPGSALTTYHLLCKRKLGEKLARPPATPERKSVTNEAPEDREKVNDEVAKLDLNKNLSSSQSQTSPFDKDEKSQGDRGSSITSSKTKQNLSEKERRITANETDLQSKTSSHDLTTRKQPNVELQKASVPSTNLQPVKCRHDRCSIDDGLSLQMKRMIDHQEGKNKINSSPTRKYPSTGTKATISSIPSQSEAAGVNELLHRMRKARQALMKKQQHNQGKKRFSLTSYEVNPSLSMEQKGTRRNLNLQTTPTKAAPSNLKTANETKRTSQESKKSTSSPVPSVDFLSPFKQSAQHNSTSTDSFRSSRLLKRPVQTSGSPKILRHTTDGVFKTDRAQSKTQGVNNSQTTPGTLPRLISKPESDGKSQSNETEAASKNTRTNRHSFPASSTYYDGIHGLNYTSTAKRVDEKSKNGVNPKPRGNIKWQSSYKQPTSNQKTQYAYHYSSPLHKSIQRPKKIISEPIAAAISYLTSTQDKKFSKDKTAPIATG